MSVLFPAGVRSLGRAYQAARGADHPGPERRAARLVGSQSALSLALWLHQTDGPDPLVLTTTDGPPEDGVAGMRNYHRARR